jgi:hypothetical protein
MSIVAFHEKSFSVSTAYQGSRRKGCNGQEAIWMADIIPNWTLYAMSNTV